MNPLYSNLKKISIESELPEHKCGGPLDFTIRATHHISFEFDQGVIEVDFYPSTPVLMLYPDALPSKNEQMIRQWLADWKGNQCYLDCGSIGMCKLCTRTGAKPFMRERGILDYYHPSGKTREATKDEIDGVCMDIWVSGGPSHEFEIWLMRYGLHATAEQIQEGWKRFHNRGVNRQPGAR